MGIKHNILQNATVSTAVLLHLPSVQLLMMSCLSVLVARQQCTSRVIVASLIPFLCAKHNAAGFIMKPSRDHRWPLIRVPCCSFSFLPVMLWSVGLPITDGGNTGIGCCSYSQEPFCFLLHLDRSTFCSFLSLTCKAKKRCCFQKGDLKSLFCLFVVFFPYPEHNFVIIGRLVGRPQIFGCTVTWFRLTPKQYKLSDKLNPLVPPEAPVVHHGSAAKLSW